MPNNRCFRFASALMFCCFLSTSCHWGKKPKSNIDVTFIPDTLNIGYTYWWPETGPFIGMCGEELSLVFIGTLTQLKKPTNDPGPLYTAQEGVIKIEKVFKIKELGVHTYTAQQYVVTDCLYKSGLVIGDQVLVACYDYEDRYSIPGGQSILKIAGFDDPLVASIKTYIDNDENPLTIEEDGELWAKKDLDRALKKIIDCRKQLSVVH